MDKSFLLAAGYPHELLGHIRRLDGSDNINYLADSKRLLEDYKREYPDYESGIRELQVSMELGIISEMISILSEPMWRKRSFLNKSAIRIMSNKSLKEYEMVELLESFMQLFKWDIEMDVHRRWQIPEEETTEWYKENHSRQIYHSGVGRHSSSGNEDEEMDIADYDAELVEKVNGIIDESDETGKQKTSFRKTTGNASAANSSRTSSHTANSNKRKTTDSRRRTRPGYRRVTTHQEHTPKVYSNYDIDGYESDYDNSNNRYFIDEHEFKRIESLFERMTPREFIQNEILKSGLKFEKLMSNSIRRDARRAINGNSDAQCRMGAFYAEPDSRQTDYVEAVKWYQVSASQGNDKAQFELGMLYDSGKIKCENYKQKAMKCYLSLAESGFPSAQCLVGLKYRFGDGVEENLQEAAKWFKKSAYQGHVDAMRNLGDMYSGIGKSQEAAKWYKRAAELGDTYSEKRIR